MKHAKPTTATSTQSSTKRTGRLVIVDMDTQKAKYIETDELYHRRQPAGLDSYHKEFLASYERPICDTLRNTFSRRRRRRSLPTRTETTETRSQMSQHQRSSWNDSNESYRPSLQWKKRSRTRSHHPRGPEAKMDPTETPEEFHPKEDHEMAAGCFF